MQDGDLQVLQTLKMIVNEFKDKDKCWKLLQHTKIVKQCLAFVGHVDIDIRHDAFRILGGIALLDDTSAENMVVQGIPYKIIDHITQLSQKQRWLKIGGALYSLGQIMCHHAKPGGVTTICLYFIKQIIEQFNSWFFKGWVRRSTRDPKLFKIFAVIGFTVSAILTNVSNDIALMIGLDIIVMVSKYPYTCIWDIWEDIIPEHFPKLSFMNVYTVITEIAGIVQIQKCLSSMCVIHFINGLNKWFSKLPDEFNLNLCIPKSFITCLLPADYYGYPKKHIDLSSICNIIIKSHVTHCTFLRQDVATQWLKSLLNFSEIKDDVYTHCKCAQAIVILGLPRSPKDSTPKYRVTKLCLLI